MGQNILVTGGYGFLGQYVVKSILENYPAAQITIMDLKRPAFLLFDIDSDPRTKTIFANICDEKEMASLFSDIDAVVHLVGLVSSSIKDRDRMFKINVRGTENVLKAMQQHNVPRLIHISSVAAFGYRLTGDEPINETFEFDWEIARRSKKYYMLTKHLADVKIAGYAQKGIKSIVLHPSLMYGPGDTANSSRMIRAIKSGQIPFNMPGGTSVIHVQDVADGIVAALKSDLSDEHLLLSGYNYTFVHINQKIADLVDVSPPKKTMPRHLHRILFRLFQILEHIWPKPLQLCADDIDNAFRFRYYDNSKAKKLLGWAPKISFERTIIETKEWMVQNGYLDE